MTESTWAVELLKNLNENQLKELLRTDALITDPLSQELIKKSMQGTDIDKEGARYYCVYYPDVECPVQRKIKEFSLIDSIEPLKTDDSAVIAKTMKSVMTGSTFFLQVLATFCASCPHLRSRIYKDAKPGKLMSVGPAKVVPLQKEEKEHLDTQGGK